MPSLLSRIGGLAIPAAAARAAYKTGQSAEKRESLIDRMNAAVAKSQIDETNARGEYYKNLGGDQWFESANGDIVNRRDGTVHHGTPKQGTPHGEEHFDPTRGEPDPTTGKPSGEVGITIFNPDGSIGWKKTRVGTLTDRMKYEHTPRDMNDPPPEAPGVADGRKYDLKKRKADDLVSSFLATHDLADLTAENLQVFAGHVLDADERAALGRTRTPPVADRAISVPPITRSSPKITPAPDGKKAPPPVEPTVKFMSGADFAREKRGVDPQEEADKAALRTAHPEMTEEQISTLLRQLRPSKVNARIP